MKLNMQNVTPILVARVLVSVVFRLLSLHLQKIPDPDDTRSFEILCFDHVPGRMVEMSSCLQGSKTL